MIADKIKNRLLELHAQENRMNVEMGEIDKQIRLLAKRKEKLSKNISGNMKLRNKILNGL